jgi:hypothetical protein
LLSLSLEQVPLPVYFLSLTFANESVIAELWLENPREGDDRGLYKTRGEENFIK